MMRFIPALAALDADGNAELSAEEIKNATAALLTLDKNKDGKLDGTDVPRPTRGERMVASMVERLDQDKDGKLSLEECPERMAERFQEWDANSDGFIDKDEQAKMAESFGGRRRGGGGRGFGGGRGGGGRGFGGGN